MQWYRGKMSCVSNPRRSRLWPAASKGTKKKQGRIIKVYCTKELKRESLGESNFLTEMLVDFVRKVSGLHQNSEKRKLNIGFLCHMVKGQNSLLISMSEKLKIMHSKHKRAYNGPHLRPSEYSGMLTFPT